MAVLVLQEKTNLKELYADVLGINLNNIENAQPNLTTLEISCSLAIPQDTENFNRKFPNLNRLKFHYKKNDPLVVDLSKLINCQKLTSLELHYMADRSRLGFLYTLKDLVSLKLNYISFDTAQTPDDIRAKTFKCPWPKLKELHLHRCPEIAQMILSRVESFPEVQSLDIENYSDLKVVKNKFPKLNELTLNNSEIEDWEILKQMDFLKTLKIVGQTTIPMQIVDALKVKGIDVSLYARDQGFW